MSNFTISNRRKTTLMEYLDSIISKNPWTEDFKNRVLRAMTGEYTEDDVKQANEEVEKELEAIEGMGMYREIVPCEESKVFVGMKAEEILSGKYIDEHETSNSRTECEPAPTGCEDIEPIDTEQ